ncbi:MAG: hypothetical protein ACLSUM_00765 [Dysosmobacter welbionis]
MELSRGGCARGSAAPSCAPLLAGLPGDSGAMAWILTMAALSWEGGSPVLVSGVLPALAAPAGGAGRAVALLPARCGGRVELSALLEEYCAAKGPRKAGTGPSAPLADTGAVRHAASAVPDIGQSFRPGRGAELLPWLVVLLALWLLCRLVGERGETVLSLLFLLLLAAACSAICQT